MEKHEQGEVRSADLQGSLSSIPVDVVVQLIGYSSLTGILRIQNGSRRATLIIKNGGLCWGSLHEPQRKLGQRLVSSSLITETQLAECLEVQGNADRKERLGEILITKGLLGPDMLRKSLEEQIKEAFFEILDWKHGSFSFVVINNFPAKLCELDKQIENLLLEKAVSDDNEQFMT